MKSSNHKKISLAEKILEKEKEKLIEIITKKSEGDYENLGSWRDFLHLIEEDAKYKIKKLKLPKGLKRHYINKISEIYGEYSESQPNKKEKYYDDEFYID